MRFVALLVGLGAALVLPVRAVDLTLVTTNVSMPAGSTFQMPVTGSDALAGPLTFDIVSIKPAKIKGAYAPSTNPSLLLNVSGVDATNGAFAGALVLQLFSDLTSNTTARIISLVESNFYNGLTFHRVVQNFVAQGGDPAGNGTGGTGVTFDDEFVASLTFNGFAQLAMANSGRDSNDSQFFITDDDCSVTSSTAPSPQWLNFRHTIFGQQTRGFDVLTKIMETPVNPGTSQPLVPVVINSAAIISDPQAAVLRLTADAGYTGIVSVTVSAKNANHQSTQQTFTVNVVSNSVNSPPFLGPIPSSLVVTQNSAVNFLLSATDIDNDRFEFILADAFTSTFPSNLTVALIPISNQAGHFWLYPDLTTTGVQHLVLGVTDSRHPFETPDTQAFTLTIWPISPAPTMNIVPQSGVIKVVTNTVTPAVTNTTHGVTKITPAVTNGANDSVKITGLLQFNNLSDHTFTSNEVLRISVGDAQHPVSLILLPDFKKWKAKHGVVSWKSPPRSIPPPEIRDRWGSNLVVSVRCDSVHGKFKLQMSGFDFPSNKLTNPITVGIALGNDYGSDTQVWTQKKPGNFVLP